MVAADLLWLVLTGRSSTLEKGEFFYGMCLIKPFLVSLLTKFMTMTTGARQAGSPPSNSFALTWTPSSCGATSSSKAVRGC